MANEAPLETLIGSEPIRRSYLEQELRNREFEAERIKFWDEREKLRLAEKARDENTYSRLLPIARKLIDVILSKGYFPAKHKFGREGYTLCLRPGQIIEKREPSERDGIKPPKDYIMRVSVINPSYKKHFFLWREDGSLDIGRLTIHFDVDGNTSAPMPEISVHGEKYVPNMVNLENAFAAELGPDNITRFSMDISNREPLSTKRGRYGYDLESDVRPERRAIREFIRKHYKNRG